YLVALIPIGWALSLNLKIKTKNLKIYKLLPFYLFTFLLFSTLLFTQSRSGFLGFVLSYVFFWGITFLKNRHNIKSFIKPFLIVNCTLIIANFIFGSPFAAINKYFSLKSIKSGFTPAVTSQNPPSDTQIAVGGTESSAIRKIVWKGAIDIFRHYPLFGSGVETFAYSYYQFRPVEHNLVSEWDFLYNKAHNEYLNYLATTGIFGLGSYLLLISAFIFWSLNTLIKANKSEFKRMSEFAHSRPLSTIRANSHVQEPETKTNFLLITSLLSGYVSILVTNFFGFSVVVTSLYFFLIPAFALVLLNDNKEKDISHNTYHASPVIFIPLILATFYLLLATVNYWRADFFYAKSQKFAKQGNYPESYQNLYRAKNLFPNEPVYLSEISAVTANLALMAAEQKQSSPAGELENLAISYSEQAKNISPKNLNVLKTRVRVFYLLSLIKPAYLTEAVDTLLESMKLAPTDPKLVYNLGLLYAKMNNSSLAIQTIEKAIQLKPDYVDARNALELLYEETGDKQKALEQLQILIKLAPENAAEFQKRLDKLKTQ
ncbi:MAG: O-antigen ligase family protein, partial [Microgenomates group bacterium]